MRELQEQKNVLDIALTVETGSVCLFQALLGATQNPDVKDFCERAVKDEANHFVAFRRIQRESSAVRILPPHNSPFAPRLAEVEQDAKDDIETVVRLAKDANDRSALALAILRKSRAVTFYEQLIKEFPDYAQLLGEIITEEDHHLERLQDLALTDPAMWGDQRRKESVA